MRQNAYLLRFLFTLLVCLLFSIIGFGQTEGELQVLNAKSESRGLCPLKKTSIKAEISGFMSRVTVTQEFQNPFNETIEAVYTFPLPNDAAVDDMTMLIGERVIKGKIMERKAAQETYEKAKQEGKVTALLEQQRPNIFMQSVANITPNAEIKVVISYVETLKFANDTYEFTFPMTVGKRYIPLSVSDEDAAKISPTSEMRPAHTVSLEMNIEAGVSIENLFSNTHLIETQQFSASRFYLRLKDENEIPNRDFVLKYKTAGAKIEDAILTHKTENGGFFTMILQPPNKVFPADTMPKEIVFVLDTSGSMSGFPIEKAKEAMKLTLDNLNPNDTFNLITFAGDTSVLFSSPVPATAANLKKAQEFLASRQGGGGTEMMKAIKTALEASDSQQHVRIVCFMTDGYVGNEPEIIAEVQKHPNARVFGFGIGSSVNRYLLDEISREGRGEVEYVGLNEDGSAAAKRFYERIRNPLLTDISLEFQGVRTAEIFPKEIPDLFDTKPVAIVGRYLQGGDGKVVLHGKMQGQIFSREIPVNFPEQNAENDVLAKLWARRKVADLMRQDLPGLQAGKMKDELQQAITGLGLEFRLLTPFTSFVAVEEQVVTDGSQTKRVDVPVASPKGVIQEQEVETGSGVGRGNGRGYGIGNVYGAVNATVEVTSSNSIIDTSESAVQTNITTSSISTLQLNGRGFQSVLSLAPGVTQTSNEQQLAERNLVSSNGQRPTSNLFQVDGANVNLGVTGDENSVTRNAGSIPVLTASGSTNAMIASDAIGEVAIKTSNFTPNEQKISGAQIDITSKAGTNSFRGSLFEQFGNEALNANNFMANSRNFERAPSRLNQFGGTFGGYFGKDKAFFFSNYEGLRLRQPSFLITEVPNLTSRQNAVTTLRPILNAFPLPNGRPTANGLAQFSANFVNPAAHDLFGLRVDFQPTNEWQINGRFTLADSKAQTRGDNGLSLNSLKNANNNYQAFSGKSTNVLNPNVVVEGLINFSQNKIAQQFTLDNFGGANAVGLSTANGFVKYDFTGQNAALGAGAQIETKLRQFQIKGGTTMVYGRHSMNFGVDFRRLTLEPGANLFERSTLFAGVNLGGTAARINEVSRQNLSNAVFNNFSLYAQDMWRITSKFNFTFGLRWEINPAPSTNGSERPLALVEMSNPLNLTSLTTQNKLWRTDLANFAPRASVAYSIFRAKTVFRAGFGLFYDFGNPTAGEIFANSAPYYTGRFARNSVFTAIPTNDLRTLMIFAPDFQTPRTWVFSAGIQQEIWRNNALNVAYIGAFGRKLTAVQTLTGIDPIYNFVRLTINLAESDYHGLQTSFTHRFSNRLVASLNYTLAKSLDNFSPDSAKQANLTNFNTDRAPSDFDARHNFSASVSYDIPAIFDSGISRKITKDWSVSTLFNARTAFPLNVTYARVNDFGLEFYRPDLLTNAPLYRFVDGVKQLNPNAFSIPTTARQGSLGRNALRGFPFFQMDLALQRRIKITNESHLRFSIEAFNLLNNRSLADTNGFPSQLATLFPNGAVVANSTFGQVTNVLGGNNFTPFYLYGGARNIQLSAKFVF